MEPTKEIRKHIKLHFCIFTTLFFLCCLKADIHIEQTPSLINGLLGHDLTLPCLVTDKNKPLMELDLNVVGIRWKKMLSNGSEIDLYKFINLAHNQIRPGSSIDNRELKRGNASLTLQHMQKSDEGEYTCIVFITPYKASAKMDVQLLAQPNVYLSSTSPLSNSELTVVEGKESSVTCEVSNYYPEKVKIRWRKYKKGFGIGLPMDKFTYFTVPKENSDESFTVTSLLTLKPSILEEDGDVCYCIVTHASFSHDRNISFTIRVKEPEADKHLLAGTIIPSVLLCLVVVTLITLYCKPAPPKVSEFVGLSDLFHGKRSTLSCMVSGFNPKNIEILFYLKRTDGLTFLINSWKYSSPPVQCNDTVDNAGHTESQPLSSRNSSRNNSVMELAVIPQPKRSYFLYSFLHSFHITPDIEKDNRADLKMIVIHSALKYPLCIQHTLRIKGDLLKLSVIRHPQYFKHGEEVTLTCDMSKYVQGSLNISWLKKDLMKEKPSLNIHSKGKTRDVKYKHEHTAEEKRGHLYISSSSLTFNLNVKEDHGTKYICTAHNPKTGQSVQSFLEIFVTAIPVMEPIKSRPSVQHVGQQMELSCNILSFHPQKIVIQWYKEETILPTTVNDLRIGEDGLYSVTSFLNYTPQAEDHGKVFRCQVDHQSFTDPEIREWKLEDLRMNDTKKRDTRTFLKGFGIIAM